MANAYAIPMCRWCHSPYNGAADFFCVGCEDKLRAQEVRGVRRECFLRLRCACPDGMCAFLWKR